MKTWIGRIATGLPVLFLLFDAAMKLADIRPVREASARIGWPDHANPGLGLVLAACVLVHVVPRTAVLGAVLLTGYLGGAVAIHVRIGDPMLGEALFPVYVAMLLWGGLYLRDPRVRAAIATVH